MVILIKENVIVGSKAQQTTYYWRGTRKYRHPPGKYRKIQSRTTIVLLRYWRGSNQVFLRFFGFLPGRVFLEIF